MAFQYTARDSLGKTHNSTIDSATAEEATEQLRRDGFQVIEIQDEDDDGDGIFSRGVSKKDIIYLTSQLAIMVETGITISTALQSIFEQEENPTLRKVLVELRASVEGGDDFSTALAKHPKLFDQTYISLVKASEATGTLGEMLEQIADYLRKDADARGKVRAAMAYPAVMMVMAVCVTIFLLTFILPKFIPLFKSKGTELPMPTKVLIGVSDVIMGYWYIWAALAVASLAAYIIGRRTEQGRRVLDWIKISMPILGPTFRKVIISRSIRTLGTMLGAGVSMVDSIKLCAEVAGNVHYHDVWLEVLAQVTGGRRICEVLAGNPLFPNVLVQMIASGEETGKLDLVLHRVSIYYDREVETSLKTATSLIEPIMISVMGVVVGGIGMALMLPIFSLSRQH